MKNSLFFVLIIILAISSVFIVSCDKKEPKNTDDQLVSLMDENKRIEAITFDKAKKLGPDVLVKLNVQQVIAKYNIKLTVGKTFDQFYIPVSEKFVDSEISDSIFEILVKNGKSYKLDQNDCDDFALAGMFVARREYYYTKKETRPVSILFGEFHYITRANDPHAINCFIYKKNNELLLGFFEPQLGRIISLTESEISSCIYWRF